MNYSHDRSGSRPQQLSLFEPSATYQISKKNPQPDLVMSQSFLAKWKQSIYDFQQSQRNSSLQQTNLISPETNFSEIDSFDPFSIKTHTDQFYSLPEYSLSESCLYFILDIHHTLLLYVGETKRSPQQRWLNHDCKSYIQNYLELHRRYDLPVIIRSAFWWSVPESRKQRQKLEKELILKWRSPFNKESWQWWAQPFK